MTTLFSRLCENYRLGYYNKVVAIAEQEIQSCVASSDSSKIQAASYFQLGDFQKCYDILVELEKIYDNNSDYLSLYAACSRRLGLLEKSSQLFTLALSISPDSFSIKNNYANLLIDLREFDAAQKLLDEVLDAVPNYADAVQNKNRLEFVRTEQVQKVDVTPSEQVPNLLEFGDPLLLAFAADEVVRSSKRYKFKTNNSLNSPNLPSPDSAKTAQDFLKAAYQSSSAGDYNFAIKLCSQALIQIGPQGLIYACVSDLYLNIGNFLQSEFSLLQAVSLDGPSPKRMLNLTTFASMRGDIKLAHKYLEIAASLDASNPHLHSIAKSLNEKAGVPFDFSQKIKYPESRKTSS